MFINAKSKIKVLKFVDHWIGGPICVLLALVHRLTHPFYQIFLKVTIKKSPCSILVIKFFGLGSIILASALLRSIRDKYPNTKIIFLTFKNNSDLVKRLRLSDEVRSINTRNLFTIVYSIFSNLSYFSFNRPEIVIDLEFFSKFSTIMSYLSGANWRLGFYAGKVWRAPFINVPVYFNYSRHILEMYSVFGSLINVEVRDLSPSHISLGSEDKDFVKRLFLERKVYKENFLLGVNINASELASCRKWPKERFACVINTLLKEYKDLIVFLMGDADEKKYTSSLLNLVEGNIKGRVVDVSGKLSLGQYIALLSRLQLLLTNDSGPFHFARAQRVYTISIWGPGSPDLYGPCKEENNQHMVIYKRWPCSPCLYIHRTDAGYFCKNTTPCLSAINSQEVIQLVKEVITIFREKRMQ